MRVAMLLVTAFVQSAACSAALAGVPGGSSAIVAQGGLGGAQGIQPAHGSLLDMGAAHMDVNETAGEPMHSRSWYHQPSRIVVLVLATLAVLSLLAMTMRGSRTDGATIAK